MPAQTPIAIVAERVRGLVGWRRRAAAAGAGAVSALAMAPFFFWPVLWLTLPVLVWLIDGAADRHADQRRGRRLVAAAGAGWWWGFGYFLAGLYWIGDAFLVEAEVFAFLMPAAVMAMPAGLALFYAAATGIASLVWQSRLWRVLGLALALSAAEWLRGHILSGFPWNVLGYALTYPLELMQSAAVLGIYGLTLAAVLIFSLPALLVTESASRRSGWAMALAVALLPLLVAGALGWARLADAPSATVPGVKIRIVQASTSQRDRLRPEQWPRILRDHLDLSARDPAGKPDGLAGVTHVLWPETAMPFPPLEHPEVLSAIGDLLPEGTTLIAGAIRVERHPATGNVSPVGPRIFNSLLVLGKGGFLVALYDKIRLVPFGEFLPVRPLLAALGLREIAERGGFTSGSEPRPLLAIPGLPAAALPLICYEAIFPGANLQGTGADRQRPAVIVNVTNDGWFGNTSGPRQHLHQARVRAVEEGLPLLRAANNGISAGFDAYGRPVGYLGIDVRGTMDVSLPVALAPPLYARFGDSLFFAAWLCGVGVLGCVVWRQ
ncbi:MAG TPA: apolipoprotein N-acyltransferase [Hyphomicrobiaceae bacterium]|nr:apolipoprotein N-acyltransferase [Hyphomicrobiaceae bacterium]